MPVYNAEKYLRECLDSILAQDVADFELVCVDDASTDGSLRILEEYGAKDARIIVLRHAENKGCGCACNTLLAQARGKYIAWVDSDDWVLPSIWSKAVDILETDDEIDIVCYGHQAVCTDFVANEILRLRYPKEKAASELMTSPTRAAEKTDRVVLKTESPFYNGSLPDGKYAVTDALEHVSLHIYRWTKLYRADMYYRYAMQVPSHIIFEDVALFGQVVLAARYLFFSIPHCINTGYITNL
jgi:glycosyltransferase involved in cell wall biosynthesis